MKKQDRKEMQDRGDAAISKARKGKVRILKTDSLNQRARKLGIATDMPMVSREYRRRDLKTAVRKETVVKMKKEARE
jgi:hypothetical protein